MPTLDGMRNAALSLLPPGRAFTRRLTSVLADFLEGCVVEFARVQDELELLWLNAVPSEADVHLDVWEKALAIVPDVGASLASRRLAVIAKLRGRTDFSREAWEQYVQAYGEGYALTDVAYVEPFRAGVSRVGARVFSDDWAFVTRVTITGSPNLAFRTLLLRDLQRAHTLVLINDGMDLDPDPDHDLREKVVAVDIHVVADPNTEVNRNNLTGYITAYFAARFTLNTSFTTTVLNAHVWPDASTRDFNSSVRVDNGLPPEAHARTRYVLGTLSFDNL